MDTNTQLKKPDNARRETKPTKPGQTQTADTDPTSSRIRQLKEDSGLTWDQLRLLFGVSRRMIRMWAGGGHMNTRNQQRLTWLEQTVEALGATLETRHDKLMRTPEEGGRSIFQQTALAASRPQRKDIEALTESTGAGTTVHGDCISAETIDEPGQPPDSH